MIHPTAVIHPGTRIDPTAEIGPFCVIGSDHGPLTIGPGSVVRSHTIIEGASFYGDRLETGHHVLLRSGNRAGTNFRVGSYSSFEGGAEIGDFVRVHGRCEATRVTLKHFARVYGGCYLTDNRLPPSDLNDPPVIDEGAVLCMGVLVIAGVRVGVGSFVAGNTTVARDVPNATALMRDGSTRSIFDVSYRDVQHPWTGHYAHSYPEDAWGRIAVLHSRLVEEAACAS